MKKEDAFTFVFLGRSGSGKDTQLELLTAHYRPHLIISTGDLFRALAKFKSPFGRKVKEMLAAGALPPSWLASYLWLRELIKKLKGGQHLLTTGVIRRVDEAELLDTVMEFLGRRKPLAIYLVVSEKTAAQRLLARGRGDDTPEAIRGRLEYFNKNVLPVIKYYHTEGRLIEVDGEPSVEETYADILKTLKEFEKER